MNYKEIEGDLITYARNGMFDVIVHGCNCLCSMGAGIAPQMAKNFNCDKFPLESDEFKGDINKLGSIDYKNFEVSTMSVIPEGYDGATKCDVP